VALEDNQPRLGSQEVAPPTQAVALEGTMHALVGDTTTLQLNTSPRAEPLRVIRAQRSGNPMNVLRVFVEEPCGLYVTRRKVEMPWLTR
jgi:hypothetical protein